MPDATRAVLIQTSDAVNYAAILDVTSQTAKEFCRRHGLTYRQFIGLKHGTFAWHSTYNRIHMMKELLDEGHVGWVLYLDADAYIHDLDFPIVDYLRENQNYAMISVRATPTAKYWDVNAGVIFLNFGHPLGQRIARELNQRFATATQTPEFSANSWPDIDLLIDDQGLLNRTLMDNPGWQDSIRYEPESLMNYLQGSFIRHHLRAATPDLAMRLEAIRIEVAKVMTPAT